MFPWVISLGISKGGYQGHWCWSRTFWVLILVYSSVSGWYASPRASDFSHVKWGKLEYVLLREMVDGQGKRHYVAQNPQYLSGLKAERYFSFLCCMSPTVGCGGPQCPHLSVQTVGGSITRNDSVFCGGRKKMWKVIYRFLQVGMFHGLKQGNRNSTLCPHGGRKWQWTPLYLPQIPAPPHDREGIHHGSRWGVGPPEGRN